MAKRHSSGGVPLGFLAVLQRQTVHQPRFDDSVAARRRARFAFQQQLLSDFQIHGLGSFRIEMNERAVVENRAVRFAVPGIVDLFDDSFVGCRALVDPIEHRMV